MYMNEWVYIYIYVCVFIYQENDIKLVADEMNTFGRIIYYISEKLLSMKLVIILCSVRGRERLFKIRFQVS